MKPLSRYEKCVVGVTCAAGLGVALTAALASSRSVQETPEKEKKNEDNGEIELVVDLSLPKSQEEAVQMWMEAYLQNKEVLGKAFRFIGQMAVAPVAMIAIDAGYAWYKGRAQ